MTTQGNVKRAGLSIAIGVLLLQSMWLPGDGVAVLAGFSTDPAWMWWIAGIGWMVWLLWPSDRFIARMLNANSIEVADHADVLPVSRADR